MAQLQSWQALYKELAERIIEKIPEVKWVDLWSNQIGFIDDEQMFPTPSVFVSFRMRSPEDAGDNIQNVQLQIDMYYYHETFADTFEGSYNQANALAYLQILTKLHQAFHGTSGENYSSMQRIDVAPVEAFKGNFYRISFGCLATDISASNVRDQAIPGDINLTEGYMSNNINSTLFDITID